MVALVAISIQSIFSLSYYRGLTPLEREETTDLTQHTATIHMNVLFAFLLALILLKGSKRTIWTVVVLAIPVTWAYVLSQRRAAMISLIIGVLMLMIVLWFKRRRAFWAFAPTSIFLGTGFVVATWNATGALGLASTSVKSVLFPDQLGAEEESSNLYRVIESFDLWFTIRSAPLTGRGFGQQFLMPIPLPDISFVEFWQFIPHNSILYMWIKLGFLGFVAMFFMFLRGVQSGSRSVLLARTGDDVATVFAGLSSVVMFVVFAYVDIAWDTRSTVFLAVAFALCADFMTHPESIVQREAEPRSWPEMLTA
jgi:O-antigen ligase